MRLCHFCRKPLSAEQAEDLRRRRHPGCAIRARDARRRERYRTDPTFRAKRKALSRKWWERVMAVGSTVHRACQAMMKPPPPSAFS